MLAICFANFFHGLRPLGKRFHGFSEKRLDLRNVRLDRASQTSEQRVEQSLNVIVNDCLDWYCAHSYAVNFDFTKTHTHTEEQSL